MNWISELRLYMLRVEFVETVRKTVLTHWQSMPEADREKVRAIAARRQRAKSKRNAKEQI
jgi:hypothetical protein